MYILVIGEVRMEKDFTKTISLLVALIFVVQNIACANSLPRGNSCLAPKCFIFSIMLDRAFHENSRRLLDQYYSEQLAGNTFGNTLPEKLGVEFFRKVFEPTRVPDVKDVSLAYDDSQRIGLVAGIVEYRPANSPDTAPGGILVLSPKPLLSKEKNKEYWRLWEESEDFREYEKNKVRNMLTALGVQYEDGADGNLIYLNAEGLRIWKDFCEDIKKTFDEAMCNDKDLMTATDRIGPANIERTLLFKQLAGSVYLDYCRLNLLNKGRTIPMLEFPRVGGEMYGSPGSIGIAKKINFTPILIRFVCIAGNTRRKCLLSTLYSLPSPLDSGLVALMSDWRTEHKRARFTRDMEHLLFCNDSGSLVYCAEIFEYHVRQGWDRSPNDDRQGIEFYSGLRKLMERVVGGNLDALEQIVVTGTTNTAKVGSLGEELDLKVTPFEAGLGLLDEHVRNVFDLFAESINYSYNLPVIRKLAIGRMLIEEIEKLLSLVKIYNDKLKAFFANTDEIERLLQQFDSTSGNYKKLQSLIEGQLRNGAGILTKSEKDALNETKTACKRGTIDIQVFRVIQQRIIERTSPFKSKVEELNRNIANVNMLTAFFASGIDSTRSIASLEYFHTLTQDYNVLFPGYLIFIVKMHIGDNSPDAESARKDAISWFEDHFAHNPKAKHLKYIYDGDPTIFRSLLLFMKEYEEPNRQELVKSLHNLYNRSGLDAPNAAFVLAYYYIYLKSNGNAETRDPQTGETVSIDVLIHQWIRNAFGAIPRAMAERMRLNNDGVDDVASFDPNTPAELQGTHRLLHFFINFFTHLDETGSRPILKTPSGDEPFSYEFTQMDSVISSMLEEREPQWNTILAMYLFEASVRPAEIKNVDAARFHMTKLIDKEIPDEKLAAFLSYLDADKCLTTYIWADVLKKYVEEKEIESRYPATLKLITNILANKSDHAIAGRWPYLSQWYFKDNDVVRGIEIIDMMISGAEHKKTEKSFPSVFVPVALDSVDMPATLKEPLMPYVSRLENAKQLIADFAAESAEKYLKTEEEIIPEFDYGRILSFGEIAWSSDAEKQAVIELLTKSRFAQMYFMEQLSIKINERAELECGSISQPAKGSNTNEHYRNQFARVAGRLSVLDTIFSQAASHFGITHSATNEEPLTAQEAMAHRYQRFSKQRNNIDNVVASLEAYASQNYLQAEQAIRSAVLPLEKVPTHANGHLTSVKKIIEEKATRYLEAQQRFQIIVDTVRQYDVGQMKKPFANIQDDMAFLQSAQSAFPGLFKEIHDYDFKSLSERMREVQKHAEKLKETAVKTLDEILDLKIPLIKDWMVLRNILEEIQALDSRTFSLFYEEAEKICLARYSALYDGIMAGLFDKTNSHSIMDEGTFIRISQLAFISRELYGFLQDTENHEAIKSRLRKLYEVQSVSHAAFVMQKIKINRIMLTVLAEAERRQKEEMQREIRGSKFFRFSARPVPNFALGSSTRALIPAGSLPDFDLYRDPDKKLMRLKKLFRPGNRIIFAASEAQLSGQEPMSLPLFEIIDVRQDGIVVDCVNYSLFNESSLQALITKHVAQNGYFDLQLITDTIERRDFLESLWDDLKRQERKMDITKSGGKADAGQKGTQVAKGAKPKGPQQGTAQKGEQQFEEVQISRRYNNNPNNLINALLGLSTTSTPYTGLPKTAKSNDNNRDGNLNDSQNDAFAFITRAVTSEVPDSADRTAFVQGPGGCGKTHTLALLCQTLIQRCVTVCLTAPTHVATDKMVKKVLETLHDIDISTQIGRFGSEELKIDSSVYEKCFKLRRELLDDILADTREGGMSKKGRIISHTISGRNGDHEIRRIKQELGRDIDILLDALQSHLVIVDEGGMTGFDQVLLLADKAVRPRGSIAVFGDPKQLPYYGLGPTHQQLIRDVFDVDEHSDRPVVFSGIDLRRTVFAEWAQEVFSTSLLEDRHGKYGTHSFFFERNHRSTPLITELLNRISYVDEGNTMESTRLPLNDRPENQLIMFESPDAEREELLLGKPGQFINKAEAGQLLRQMAIDMDTIQDFSLSDVVFISPYKAQIELFENMLVLHCLLNELTNFTKEKGLSSYFDVTASRNADMIAEELWSSIKALPNAPYKSIDEVLFRNLLRSLITGKRTQTAQQLKDSLVNTYRSNFTSQWYYCSRFTLGAARGIEVQLVSDGYNENLELQGMHFSTVHKIQGDEKRAVYISLVRSNIKGSLGFLGQKLGPHMLTTAIGRAKDYVRIAFNKRTWQAAADTRVVNRRTYYTQKSGQMIAEAYRFIREDLHKPIRTGISLRRTCSGSV